MAAVGLPDTDGGNNHSQKRTSRMPSWSQLIFEFTQTTTFHGVRFITLPTPYFCRRVLWVFMVLGVSTSFSYIMAERIQKYFKYQVNVNVDIVYRKEIVFPAVTICNHNFLRATKAYHEGLYDIVTEEFGKLNQDEDAYQQHNAKGGCSENYRTVKGYRVASIKGPHRFYNFSGITAHVCTRVCSNWNMTRDELLCRGFIYDKQNKICSVINGTISEKLVIEISHQPGIDYHDRATCKMQKNAIDIYGFSETEAAGTKDGDLPAKWKDDVEGFVAMAAHQREDMIHTCRWYGHPCYQENFVKSITDYGVCYTFHGGSDNATNSTTEPMVPLQTNQTGSTYGLQLKINVEEYEYMEGPNSDIGIKVYLHPIDELPMVRDLGFAVPPGRHSLIGVKATEILNKMPPHGECGNKTLEYYNTYSWFRCHRDCETREVVSNCGCRDIFMDQTGDNEVAGYCDMQTFFDCSRPLLAHAGASISPINGLNEVEPKEQVDCECVKPCNRTIFEPIVSNAALSRLSLDSILSSSTDDLRSNRQKALDVQIRLDGDLFMEVLTTLYNVREMYEDFVDTTLKKTENMQQNLIDPTVDAMKVIFELFQEDFNRRLFEGLDEVIEDLDTVFGPSRDSFYFLIDRVIRNTKIVTLHVRNLVVDNFLYAELDSLVETTIDYAKVAVFTLPKYYDMVTNVSLTLTQLGFRPSEFTFLPTILAKSSQFCETKLDSFNNMTKMMHHNLEKLLQVITGFDKHTGDVPAVKKILKDLMTDLQTYVTSYEQLKEICLEMYYITVREVRDFNQTYLSQLLDHVDLQYSFDYEEESKEVRRDETDLIAITNGYLATGNVSKLQLQDTLSEEMLNDYVSRQRALITKVKFRLTERLRRRVDKARADVIDWYHILTENARTIQDYMQPGFMEHRSREMLIWHRPVAVMSGCNCTVEFQEDEQTLNITGWSKDALLGTTAAAHQEEIIDQFFDPINSAIDAYDDELDNMEQDMTSTLKSLRNLMTEYRNQDEMDHNFVLKNFLQMDIYYSEKSLQRIEHMESYGIEDLLGDVGGYMGLLLGASVTTIFELLDLIIYNWIRKFHEYKEKREFNKQKKKRQRAYWKQLSSIEVQGMQNGGCSGPVTAGEVSLPEARMAMEKARVMLEMATKADDGKEGNYV